MMALKFGHTGIKKVFKNQRIPIFDDFFSSRINGYSVLAYLWFFFFRKNIRLSCTYAATQWQKVETYFS